MANDTDLTAWADFLAAAISAGHDLDKAIEIANAAMAEYLKRTNSGHHQQQGQP